MTPALWRVRHRFSAVHAAFELADSLKASRWRVQTCFTRRSREPSLPRPQDHRRAPEGPGTWQTRVRCTGPGKAEQRLAGGHAKIREKWDAAACRACGPLHAAPPHADGSSILSKNCWLPIGIMRNPGTRYRSMTTARHIAAAMITESIALPCREHCPPVPAPSGLSSSSSSDFVCHLRCVQGATANSELLRWTTNSNELRPYVDRRRRQAPTTGVAGAAGRRGAG